MKQEVVGGGATSRRQEQLHNSTVQQERKELQAAHDPPGSLSIIFGIVLTFHSFPLDSLINLETS